jgi:hypothetical protein
MSYSARFCAVAIFALMIAVKMSALFVDLLDDILAGRIGGAVEAVGGGKFDPDEATRYVGFRSQTLIISLIRSGAPPKVDQIKTYIFSA